jgi:malate synthase
MTTALMNNSFDTFIEEEVSLISELNLQRSAQLTQYSKRFLDNRFPLAKGSHSDVCSYVVYYKHVLAFFADGTTTGLRKPAQFVALSGPKDEPESIVLCDEGSHVEITFNAKGSLGSTDRAGIDDIQVQTSQRDIASNAAANDEQSQWFSLMRSDAQVTTNKRGQTQCNYRTGHKEFTDKNGNEYPIN